MSQRLTINMNNKPIYDIVYEQDFNNLVQELEPFGIREKKLCIITDSRVKGFYADEVRSLLQGNCGEVFVYDFPNGEQSKNLDTVKNIYQFLIQNKFGRKDMLLALGGGVVGDMTGFTAATYLRGVDFVQIPTTLLAQVDSSIVQEHGRCFLYAETCVYECGDTQDTRRQTVLFRYGRSTETRTDQERTVL